MSGGERTALYVFLFLPGAMECLGYLYLVMIQNTLDMGIRNWLQMDINQTIRVDNTTQNNGQPPVEKIRSSWERFFHHVMDCRRATLYKLNF